MAEFSDVPRHQSASARGVAFLKGSGGHEWHADGGGLYLHIDPTGSKRWIFVFQWSGKRKEMGLGSASIVTLAEAREARNLGALEGAFGLTGLDVRDGRAIYARQDDIDVDLYRLGR